MDSGDRGCVNERSVSDELHNGGSGAVCVPGDNKSASQPIPDDDPHEVVRRLSILSELDHIAAQLKAAPHVVRDRGRKVLVLESLAKVMPPKVAGVLMRILAEDL